MLTAKSFLFRSESNDSKYLQMFNKESNPILRLISTRRYASHYTIEQLESESPLLLKPAAPSNRLSSFTS